MFKYYSGDKIKSMRWAGPVAHMGEGRGARKVLDVKPEGKRQLGTRRSRWNEYSKGFSMNRMRFEDCTDRDMNRDKGILL